MIQKKYIEIGRKGNWVLYRVSYYYSNKPYWYYELHDENTFTKKDKVISFGQKKFSELILLLNSLNDESIDLSNVKVLDNEKVLYSNS